MVLIPPEFDGRRGEGADISGLVAAIKCALNAEEAFETGNLNFRVLGNGIVIEGVIDLPGGDRHVRRIAEGIAGPSRVIIRISCPRT